MGRKSRKYIYETVPTQNQDMRSYANLEESRNTTAAIQPNLPQYSGRNASMFVEPGDLLQANTVQSNIYDEIRDLPDQAASYFPFPPAYQ